MPGENPPQPLPRVRIGRGLPLADLLARGEPRIVGLRLDWRDRVAQMRTDMPNLSKVVDRFEACRALAAYARRPVRIPPLLLMGPPGVGNTHFASGVAALLGVPTFVYALESAETVAVLGGTESTGPPPTSDNCSRFEAPAAREAVSIARAVVRQVLGGLKLSRRFQASTGDVVPQLALLESDRRMHKVLAAATSKAVVRGRQWLTLPDLLVDSETESGPLSAQERDGSLH